MTGCVGVAHVLVDRTYRAHYRQAQMTTRALITGITGQDGSYLAELLLDKGYEVHGIMRRSSSFHTGRIDHIFDRLHLHYGDMCDGGSLLRIVSEVRPEEVYNLAAQSHVRVSFDLPEYTADTIAGGTGRLLEAIRVAGLGQLCRVYQASSSEMFGGFGERQNETTPFHPRSPYAAAKVHAHQIAVNYRESYGMFVACGILFNHESPRRGETFVTRKITRAIGRILAGTQSKLALGHLDARRDWGWAPEYVEAMWRMLQHRSPDDFVIATGTTMSVQDAMEELFERAGLQWRDHVTHDPRLARPAEVETLCGDASKASSQLGWQTRVHPRDVLRRMLSADIELARREKLAALD